MSLENRSAPVFQNWEAVEQTVASSVAESTEQFEPATISNVIDLLRAVSKQCPIPNAVTKGYWSTIRLCWKDIEIEVFDDRYELYRFNDGATDIEYFERTSGADVSPDLIAKLPKLDRYRD